METTAATDGRVSLIIQDNAQLYRVYMPFVKNAGIFVPTTQRYSLGDRVTLALRLPDASEQLDVAGKVVWITPVGAQGARTPGIGIQFAQSHEADALRDRIESLLAGMLDADTPTHTM